jgi:hypothetical protein
MGHESAIGLDPSFDGPTVTSDSTFQASLRTLQSMWRAEQALPIGEHRGRALGTRLPMPYAEQSLANYLTPVIRDVVRREVVLREHGQQKLYSTPRIFNDLLSSQPLCFNLFGELSVDLDAATAVFSNLWPDRVSAVTAVEFEWSPGRRDPRFLNNNSAFDVAVFHTTPSGQKGFIGIEVKYHENLRVKPAKPKDRYFAVASASRFGVEVFGSPVRPELERPPLQQIWLDHLLALAMLQADHTYAEGLFVLLHPAGNAPCDFAAREYERLLLDSRSFERLTLERIVSVIRETVSPPWVEAFNDRYLASDKLPAPMRALPSDATNPLPPIADFDADQELLARFVIGSIVSGGTMFEGHLHECRVARLLGGKLAPRGVWPWDVRLNDGTRIEVRSGARSFELDGGREGDVWVFVRKMPEAAPGGTPACYYVASPTDVERARDRSSSISVVRAEAAFRRATDDTLADAVDLVRRQALLN